MNTRIGIVLIAMLLGWPLMGGCPVTVDADVELDVAADVDVSVDDDDGSSTAPDNNGDDDNDGATGDDSSDDGDSGSDDGQDQDSGDSADDAGGDDDDSADDAGGDADDDADADDDGDPDDQGDDEPAFAGSFAGEWDRVGQESLGGVPGSEQEWTTDQTVTFGADGMPAALIVPGYLQGEGGVDFVAQVKQVGDTVMLAETVGALDYTLTVTVALATYGETTAHIVLNLIHHAEGSNAAQTQDGTGVQVIEYRLQNGQLEYSSTTAYEVTWFNGSINTTWDISCEGTLTPE